MKRNIRFVGLLLVLVIAISVCLPVTALAAGETIDVSTASKGYFTVNDQSGFTSTVKIGVAFGGTTTYYDYTNGAACAYAFEKGNGTYTINVYHSRGGTSYSYYTGKSVNVTLESANAPFLASTAEVTFAAGDKVSLKAAELCQGLTTDDEKVVAIFKYISANFKYDRTLAKKITSGEITSYMPSTSKTLDAGTGICYDLSSLFAAMCRSQGIPCVITKGYVGKTYHAWNKVSVGGSWYLMDMTYSLGRSLTAVKTAANCASRITTYSQQSDSIATVNPYAA